MATSGRYIAISHDEDDDSECEEKQYATEKTNLMETSLINKKQEKYDTNTVDLNMTLETCATVNADSGGNDPTVNQIPPQPVLSQIPVTPKPDFSKYDKMKKVGLPNTVIKNRMKRDGIEKYWVCFYFSEPFVS
eukprot:198762_1